MSRGEQNMSARLGNPIRTAILVGLTAMTLGFAGFTQSHAEELKAASLRLKWLPQAQFIGYYVAKEKGWYKDEGIDLTINPGGPNIIAENMVAAGNDTFGHGGGAESILEAREKGLSIVGIGMLFQETPYRFVALKDSGIKTIQDLKGKTVSTWFSGPQFILKALLAAQGVDPGSVNIQAQANSMVPFIEGKVAMATVTVFNEGLYLKRHNVVPAVSFNPAEMGVNLPNESIITNEKVIKNDPKLVQGFMNASLKGWAYSLEHPDEAVDILTKVAPTLKRQEQIEQLEQIRTLVLYGPGKEKGVGYLDPEKMEFTNQFLVKNGVMAKPVDLKSAIDLSFWDNVPKANKVVGNPG
jgi:NitT/TauT family transport system substrate-binding protein